MPYAPTWTNANAQGRLEGGTHFVRLCDAAELAAAVNRRRRLAYQAAQDFSSHVYSGAPVRAGTIASASAPPFDDLRRALAEKVLSAPAGGMGGEPASPTAMEWLWPIAGADENRTIVSGAGGVGEGQVGLFQKLNGTGHWTDAALTSGASAVRAVHFNELRQAAEWLRRGRWTLPVYLPAGLFSPMPDTPWVGEAVANNGTSELRAAGFAVLRGLVGGEWSGLVDVTARASSVLEITADADCRIAVYRCLRAVDFEADPPTWNEYDPSASLAWSQPGGLGAGDAELIGAADCSAGVPAALSGAALTSALDAMIDGAEQGFLFRREDTGGETIALGARLIVEFDLDSPPN